MKLLSEATERPIISVSVSPQDLGLEGQLKTFLNGDSSKGFRDERNMDIL